jgi:hypothetical protein
MLRLDVSGLPLGPGGPADKALLALADNPFAAHPDPNARLVGAIGLRDPRRFQVDPRDGAAYIGDVGDTAFQEIDVAAAPGGNFGWPQYEGPLRLDPACVALDSASLDAPVHAYDDADGSGAARIVCGGIYLASACSTCSFPPTYQGDCFFGDERIGFLRRLELDGVWTPGAPAPGQPSPTDWGSGFIGLRDLTRGPDGALWYCIGGSGAGDGEVGRIHYFPSPTSGVGASGNLAAVRFAAPYPSPSGGAVRFRFTLRSPGEVALDLFDTAGRRVRRLLDGAAHAAGVHTTLWDGRDDHGRRAPAGVYVARLRAGGGALTRSATIVR